MPPAKSAFHCLIYECGDRKEAYVAQWALYLKRLSNNIYTSYLRKYANRYVAVDYAHCGKIIYNSDF